MKFEGAHRIKAPMVFSLIQLGSQRIHRKENGRILNNSRNFIRIFQLILSLYRHHSLALGTHFHTKFISIQFHPVVFVCEHEFRGYTVQFYNT